MHFYTDKAADTLRHFLDSIKGHESTWRAMVLDTTALQMPELSDLCKDHVRDAFHGLEHGENTRLFLCPDGRIFLLYTNLFSSKITPLWQGLLTAIQPHIPLSPIPENIWMTAQKTFDLSVHWETFHKDVHTTYAATDASALKSPEPTISLEESVAEILKKSTQDDFKSRLAQRATREAKRILLVEDDPLSLRLIRGAMKTYPGIKSSTIKIETAANGLEALRTHWAMPADIIFLDIEMPGLSGHQTLDCLLKMDTDVHVVMLSGNTFKEDILGAMQNGAKGFVGKPFTPQKLFGYLDKCPTLNGHTSVA